MKAARVKTEQVCLLYQHAGMVLWGSLLMAVGMVVVFRGRVPLSVSLAWLAIVTSITLARLWMVRVYHARDDGHSQSDTWGRRYSRSAIVAGSVWGAGYALYFLPGQPAYILFAACMYVGMISAATMSLTAYLPAYYGFVVPATLPVSIRAIVAGSGVEPMIGVSYWLYLAVAMAFGANINRVVRKSIELRFENSDLLDRLKEEKSSAEHNQRIAEQAVFAKNRFLAAASHDLRQPLHALGLFHGALAKYVPPGEGRVLLEKISNSTRALNQVFNSLLDVSRLDAGVVEVNKRHIYIEPLLDELRTEYEPVARARGLDVDYESGHEVVYSDPVLVGRILRNLLSNAINYTKSGRVALKFWPAGEDSVAIRVEDSGIGIPGEEFEAIFSEYHQLDNPERDRNKGLGLGLAIVQRLCRLLDVRLELESKIGVGTSFTLYLPRGDAEQVRLLDSDRPILDLHRLLVLVIDDDSDVLNAMQRLLSGWGCQTVLAESSSGAIDQLLELGKVPDVIFADYRLRGQDTGIMAIEMIREEFNQSIPAIVVSGDTSKDLMKEVADNQLRLLHKPVTPSEVRTALMQELGDNSTG